MSLPGEWEGAGADPCPSPNLADAYGQTSREKKRAVLSGRKITNFIWYFQSTKRKLTIDEVA